MKLLAIITSIAITSSAAYADPVVVTAPKAPISEKDAKDYVVRLDKAVKEVCYQASSPMIGLSHYVYLQCIKATRAQVAKDDPTGIYALKREPLVLAAN